MAWLGFTMPSAIILIAFAYGVSEVDVANSEWLRGLKLAVVAIVGLAVWSMAGSLWTDRRRITLGIAAAVFMLLMPGAVWQIAAILAGAVAGMMLFRNIDASASDAKSTGSSGAKKLALLALVIFFGLLVTLPIIAETTGRDEIDVIENFYRSGSLVFGGGHVVLPLLQAETVGAGYIDNDQFVAGYGATQAMPGPLFTFAGYLGAAMEEGSVFGPKWVLGLVTLSAVFLPSFLLIWGVLPFWSRLASSTRVRGVVTGINAVVVGILLSVLYNPIWTGSVFSAENFGLVMVLFGLLTIWKLPPWSVVVIAAAGGYVLELL